MPADSIFSERRSMAEGAAADALDRAIRSNLAAAKCLSAQLAPIVAWLDRMSIEGALTAPYGYGWDPEELHDIAAMPLGASVMDAVEHAAYDFEHAEIPEDEVGGMIDAAEDAHKQMGSRINSIPDLSEALAVYHAARRSGAPGPVAAALALPEAS